MSLWLGLVARNPVFGVSDKSRLKPVSSATETSKKNEISIVASFDMIFSKPRITKALISMRRCTGRSVPVLFANPETGFLTQDPFDYTQLCPICIWLVRLYQLIIRHAYTLLLCWFRFYYFASLIIKLLFCSLTLNVHHYKCNHNFEQTLAVQINSISPRASDRFNQVVEAKRFEGVFLCRNVCWIQKSNS